MPTANKDTKSTAPVHDIHEPHKLVQNLVDKKIRNLEKRKTRLQELKDMSTKGQDLEPEQQKAIKKLDQVVEMIDLMKDLNKSITEVLIDNQKQQKKLAKKELLEKQIERQQQELNRLKTIIQFNDILGRFDQSVRKDFTKGTNNAIKLTSDQLSQLDKLYAITSVGEDNQLESLAEKWVALADGKSREAWPGVTFGQLKELISKIVETKYFSHETPLPTTTSPSTTANTNQSNVVSVEKSEESTKKVTKEDVTTNNTKAPTSSSTQFHSMSNSVEFGNSSLNQIQSQFGSSGISFMNPSLKEDPAVVAVSSVPNSIPQYYPTPYGLTTDSLINNSIPDSNNSSLNPQKLSNNFETTSMSTIPTQTFTNQQFAALIPNPNTGTVSYSAVPVTLAAVPLTGMIGQDVGGHLTTDLMGAQTYANQQNFINSSAPDKHTNPSHERGNNSFNNNSDDNFRNNRGMRGNRNDFPKKNMNGSGGRARNPNKGVGYQNQMGAQFASYPNPKYDNQLNGQTFGNNFGGDKTSNNFGGNRGRPQQQRSNRGERADRVDSRQPRSNANVNNYSSNFSTTSAAKQ